MVVNGTGIVVDSPTRLADEVIHELAGRHHGAIRVSALIERGVTRSQIETRVRRHHLVRRHRGVVLVAGAESTRQALWAAAVLAYGEVAALARWSAADLHGLLQGRTRRIEVVVCARRRRRRIVGLTLLTSRTLHPDDFTVVDRIRVTTVARTLVDLADVLPVHELNRMLATARARGLLDLGALQRCIERNRGRRGCGRLRRALALHIDGDTGARSRWEAVLVRAVVRAGGPRGLLNVRVDVPGPVEFVMPDIYYRDGLLAVEVDDHTHDTREQQLIDAGRAALLAGIGIPVLRVRDHEVEADQTAVAHRVLAALHAHAAVPDDAMSALGQDEPRTASAGRRSR